MKKITLLALLAIAAFSRPAFGQTVSIQAPEYNGFWSALLGPNGYQNSAVSPTTTYAYNRSCYLITQAELTRMIATNSVITDFGFDFYRPHNTAITGSFTLYLQNTSDVTYNKGTTFSSIITGMQTCYNANITLPGATTAATAALNMALSSAFTWTGGGIYVAWDWHAATNTATNYARYLATYDGTSMGVNAMAPAAGPAPATLTVDVSRPSMRFRAVNTATNEIGVVYMTNSGVMSKQAPTQTVSALLVNTGTVAMNNVPVTLTVTGANAFNTTQNVSIPANGTTMVNFTNYNVTAQGMSTLIISVPVDQYTVNNINGATQSVTCNDYANNPPVAAVSFSDASYGYGGPAIICTPVRATGNYSMTGIKYAPSQSPGANYSMCGVLLDAGGNIVATTNTLNLTAASFGTYANFKFTPAIQLTSGADYYYGIAQLTSGVFPLGTMDVLATTNLNLYYYAPIGGGSIGSAQNQMGYLGMQAIYGFSNTTLEATATQTIMCKSQQGATTITLSATGPNTFTWTPGNLSGPTVVVTPTVAGPNGNVNYNVIGTDPISGCKSNAVVISVSIAASPTVNATANRNVICSGELGTPALTLTATGNSQSYTWTAGGVQTGSQVIVTPTLSTATGTISYSVVGENTVSGCQSTVAMITVTVDACTGLSTLGVAGTDLKLFPNPSVNGKATITGLSGANQVSVFNTLGQLVLTQNVSTENATIDLSSQPSGNYLIKITNSNNESKTIKLINQN